MSDITDDITDPLYYIEAPKKMWHSFFPNLNPIMEEDEPKPVIFNHKSKSSNQETDEKKDVNMLGEVHTLATPK